MWRSIRRWRDWAMHELGAAAQAGSGLRSLNYGYEKAGLTILDQPIPWNADTVLVQAEIRLGLDGPGRKSDFQLNVPRQEPFAAELVRRNEIEDHHQILFRFPPPGQTVVAELCYRGHLVATFTLPSLDSQEFVNDLHLQMPTVSARLADQSIACHTFVATQCRGLHFTALLTSPTSLVPLIDLDLRVDLAPDTGGLPQSIPAKLCSSQLGGNQALITVVPRRFYRRIGTWTATWRLGDRKLAVQQIRAISQRQFRRSLQVADARFICQNKNLKVTMTRNLPPLGGLARVGPCFLVSSKEPGMAGLCTLQVRTQVPGAIGAPLLAEEVVLVTDGPTIFAPGTLDTADLVQVSAFELRCRGTTLGSLPLSPAPAAHFNCEGGIKSPTEFTWSMAAEEELKDRMGRLLDGRGRK